MQPTLRQGSEAQLLLLSRAVASADNGVSIADAQLPDMPLVYVNPAFLRMTGYDAADVLGKNCRFLQHTAGNQAELTKLRAAIAAHEETVVLLRNFRKSGEEFCNELFLSPVFDEERRLTHYIGIQYDVTVRERVKGQVSRLNIELEQKQIELLAANEALAAYSYSVTHDLRGPLQVIGGFATLLERKLAASGSDTEKRYASKVVEGSLQMKRLIDAMLDLATAPSRPVVRTACDLSAMGRDLVHSYRERDPDRSVTLHVQDGLTEDADAPLVERVLDNLLSNAWKFTRAAADATIELGGQVDTGGNRMFFVKDNGAGFDMAAADKLFKPFSRLHSAEQFEGTGIGLSLVNRIIARHGGRLWAESTPGHGATFWFTLKESAIHDEGR